MRRIQTLLKQTQAFTDYLEKIRMRKCFGAYTEENPDCPLCAYKETCYEYLHEAINGC